MFRVAGRCLRKYFDPRGRANRREFWYWIAFCAIILFIATMIDGIIIGPMRGYIPFEQEAGRPLASVALLLLLAPTLTAAIRRFHDSNLSAWWLFAMLIVPIIAIAIQFLYGPTYSGWWALGPAALVSAIPLAYFLVKSAAKGDNRFNWESN